MMICGVEEPLQVNEQLHCLDEDSGRLVLSRVKAASVNRYSFVWVGQDDESAIRLKGIKRLLDTRFEGHVTDVLVWPSLFGDGQSPARLRLNASQRRKQGWNLQSDNDLTVATKSSHGSPIEQGIVEPSIDEGHFLVYGTEPSPETFLRSPLVATMQLLARRKVLTPSAEFINWLGEQQLTIAYAHKSEAGCRGLVVVAAVDLNLNKFLQDGAVDRLLNGPEASRVWMLPPINKHTM